MEALKPLEVVSDEDRKTFEPIMAKLKGNLKARLLGAKNKKVAEVPVRELLKSLDKKKKVQAMPVNYCAVLHRPAKPGLEHSRNVSNHAILCTGTL